ncbi:MAG: tRNA (N(6)-L-threonylcarbamoyladenosine(37)-C(2))-methylthiotransferase MtaB [Bacteroidia bacterium]|nr:tRNA (N(6)-L-threonylcarbamoyladenosine(37)-C(2))-methylthiotransferase MtaB [Bacteroidia bacterium]
MLNASKLKTVAFHTLGCKLNFAETGMLAKQLNSELFSIASFDKYSDIYVINTCSVTENADKECKKLVRRCLQQNSNAQVVIVGCYAQLKPQEIAQIPGVRAVLGAADKFRLGEVLAELSLNTEVIVKTCDIETLDQYSASVSFGDRTRAYLKIQDGCDYNCSFCTIPLARGHSRSDTIQNVVTQAKELLHSGAQEIILTGVNVGDFGRKNQESFFLLLQRLSDLPIPRIRISSVEPNLLTTEIIDFVAAQQNVMPHFHIPLQSGNDAILALMRRRYKRKLYADKVLEIRQKLPDAAIGVDVIVGFPGETDEFFLETREFIQTLPVSYLHIFTYSERDNTVATNLGKTVSKSIRNQRNAQLRLLSEMKTRDFYRQFHDTIRPVLWEIPLADNLQTGLTDNYIRVIKHSSNAQAGTITSEKLIWQETENYHKLRLTAI